MSLKCATIIFHTFCYSFEFNPSSNLRMSKTSKGGVYEFYRIYSKKCAFSEKNHFVSMSSLVFVRESAEISETSFRVSIPRPSRPIGQSRHRDRDRDFISKVSRPRLIETDKFSSCRDRDWLKVVETETLTRLSRKSCRTLKVNIPARVGSHQSFYWRTNSIVSWTKNPASEFSRNL